MGKGPDRKGEVIDVAGRQVTVTNPGKVYWPATPTFAGAGHTKGDLVRYYLAVAEGALRGISGRPLVLKRYVDGAGQPAFYQKRAPENRPPWMETVTLHFPSGRTATELVIRDAAQLLWVVNLGCIDLHPHPVRAEDLDHPDELRVDLDPVPGVGWGDVVQVALLCRQVLEEHGLTGWPKTSGSRGMHLNVRIFPRWSFDDVRRAALALAREVERRAPDLATSKWWKEERHGVFIDYNQNAKDRTTSSAYSVRPTPDARVSTPLRWEEVPGCDPAAFTLLTVPQRLARLGDPAAEIDVSPGSMEGLLALADQQQAAGLPDAPWPPNYAKQPGEAPRVSPSRRAKGPPRPRAPLLIVACAERQDEALAGLERWKARHPAVAAQLAPADVLVDTMRGRSSTWTRIRINLRSIPADQRPAAEPPDPDYDPWRGVRWK
jgi:bifunctional non-homologous end joining protein LigD